MKIPWKNYGITIGLALVAVIFIAPLVRPLIQKIPFIGKYAS